MCNRDGWRVSRAPCYQIDLIIYIYIYIYICVCVCVCMYVCVSVCVFTKISPAAGCDAKSIFFNLKSFSFPSPWPVAIQSLKSLVRLTIYCRVNSWKHTFPKSSHYVKCVPPCEDIYIYIYIYIYITLSVGRRIRLMYMCCSKISENLPDIGSVVHFSCLNILPILVEFLVGWFV